MTGSSAMLFFMAKSLVNGFPPPREHLAQAHRPALAERWLAEGFQPMTHGMGQGEVEAVVGDFVELERPAHLEPKSAPKQYAGDVVQGVAVALAQLVSPNDQRVVEQAAGIAGLGRVGQLF